MNRTRFNFDGESIDLTAGTLRKLTAFAFAAFAVGSWLQLQFDSDGILAGAIGNLLSVGAYLATFMVLGSRLHQWVASEPGTLDEFQLSRRHTAMGSAYVTLAGMVLLFFIYLDVARSLDWWLPSNDEQWTRVGMAFILAAMLLPTTFLVWGEKPGTLDESDDVAP